MEFTFYFPPKQPLPWRSTFESARASSAGVAVAPVSRERSRCEGLLAVSANFVILTVIVAEYSRNIDNQVSNNINRGSGLL